MNSVPFRNFVAVVFACLLPLTVIAGAGEFDSSFNRTGFTIADFRGTDDLCNAAAIAPDGRIILAGQTNVVGAWPLGAIARFHADGRVDSSFGTNGRVIVNAGNSTTRFNAVTTRPAGRILVAGERNANGSPSNWDIVVMQLKPDGTPDSSFGVNGIFSEPYGLYYEYATSIILRPDGKVLVGVTANFYGAHDLPMIVRLTASGARDYSFGNRNGFVLISSPNFTISSCAAIALGSDWNITLTGAAYISASMRNILYRFTPDGAPDQTFGTGGGKLYDLGSAVEGGLDLKLLPDNRPLVMGYHMNIPQITTLARFNAADGSTDASFAAGQGFSKWTTSREFFATRLLIHPRGAYLTAGNVLDSVGPKNSAGIYAVDSNGTPDSSWADNGLFRAKIGSDTANTRISAILAQSDGNVVIAGTTSIGGKDDFWVARLKGPAKPSLHARPAQGQAVGLQLSAAPNPLQGATLNISCTGTPGKTLRISLLDALGKEHATWTRNALAGSMQTFSLPVPQDLASGVYFLQVSNGKERAALRVVKP